MKSLHTTFTRFVTQTQQTTMSTIPSSSPSSSSSFYYVLAYDSSISNENNEIERVVHFYPKETSERIQCETSAFLCGLDAFMSTFLENDDDENEEEDEEEDEKTTKKKGSSSDSSFIGAKTRGKFYCAVNVASSVWCAVVEVSVDSSSSRKHPLEMAQQQHQHQGNERLRLLRDMMEREVKEKLFVNDDTAPLVVVADAEQRRRGTSSGEEEERRKWKEELKRLIDRLGERLNDESSSSFAMGVAMMKTSSMPETKEDEDVAYVLEERENRSGCFVQTSASKSLDALSLISKREAAKLRDEMESVLEEDEYGSSATRTSTTIERATRPGHDAWLWSRVIADRTKRLFFITEREDVKTLLQANDAVNELGAA
jgi:hypothetical protein